MNIKKKCHICNKKFWYDKNEKSKFELYKKVKGHCHFMGKFREAAHNICNLRHKVPREIPVKFHVAQHTITTLLLKN